METQAPWLTCRMGKKVCLLAKDEKAYFIIEVDKRLDYATEEWLEQQGVSEQLLKELQLGFTCIPISAFRGVAFSGYEAGEFLYLYLKSEKKKLMLELDCDSAWTDDFFIGIPRFAAPKTKEPGDRGWRKGKQDKELFHKLRFVAPAFLIVGSALSIGYVVTGHWGCFTLCLLCIAAQLGLAVGMPVYFTIYLPKGAKKQNVWNLEFPLFVMAVILLFRSRTNWLAYDALWYVFPAGAAVGAFIYARVKDLHREKGALLAALLLGAVACFILAGQINEVYDSTPPVSYILEVEELRSSGGRNRSYYCTVTLPDGREVELRISRSLYMELEEGDFVRVEHDTGALGIEYANVVSGA